MTNMRSGHDDAYPLGVLLVVVLFLVAVARAEGSGWTILKDV